MQRRTNRTIAAPEFYKESPGAIAGALAQIKKIELDLAGLYARWETLDSRPK